MGGIERRMNEAGVASLRSVWIVRETVVASSSLACRPRLSPKPEVRTAYVCLRCRQ